jgi:hypothetical protein
MNDFFQEHKLFLIIGVVGNALMILAAIAYRAMKGKGAPRIPKSDIKFSERWVSGGSRKNLITRLGGAQNCLAVVLGSNALIVRPMFPFNLAFFAEIYDLEHCIARDKIKRIQSEEGQGAGVVAIEFVKDGKERVVELKLRKRQEFLRAVSPWRVLSSSTK